MAIKIGNDYNVWTAATIGGTYARFAGQQDGSLGGTRATADASHKTSGGVALRVPGLIDFPIDLSFVADLPDTGGYDVVQTAFKSGAAIGVAIRKGGATGAVGDNIFLCEMIVTALNIDLSLNGVVSGTVKFEPFAAPVTSLTLA
jgi:hypothetical protein